MSDRTSLPPELRKFEYIAPEEIDAVVHWMVERSKGISIDELAREPCAKFGFSPITQQMQHCVRQVTDQTNTKNMLLQKGDMIVIDQL